MDVDAAWNVDFHTAVRVNSRADVTPHLEREYPRDFCHEGQRLKIEHELHMFGKRVRYAPRWASGKACNSPLALYFFDLLNTSLDLKWTSVR